MTTPALVVVALTSRSAAAWACMMKHAMQAGLNVTESGHDVAVQLTYNYHRYPTLGQHGVVHLHYRILA